MHEPMETAHLEICSEANAHWYTGITSYHQSFRQCCCKSLGSHEVPLDLIRPQASRALWFWPWPHGICGVCNIQNQLCFQTLLSKALFTFSSLALEMESFIQKKCAQEAPMGRNHHVGFSMYSHDLTQGDVLQTLFLLLMSG